MRFKLSLHNAWLHSSTNLTFSLLKCRYNYIYICLRHTLLYCLVQPTHINYKLNTKRTPKEHQTHPQMFTCVLTLSLLSTLPVHIGHSWELDCIPTECHISTPLSIKYQTLHPSRLFHRCSLFLILE